MQRGRRVRPAADRDLRRFLMGDVSRFERYVSTVTDARESQNRWFFFGQDTWRVTSKLTINYGLRWEIYRPQKVNGAGNGGFVDVGTGEVLVAGANGVGLDLNVESPWTNFAPRLGIAYQLTPEDGDPHRLRPRLQPRRVRLDLRPQRDAEPAGARDSVRISRRKTSTRCSHLRDGTQMRSTRRRSWPRSRKVRTDIRCCRTASLRSSSPNPIRFPTVDAWNFTIQRQLGQSMSVEVAYVGTKGTHVFAGTGGDYDPNQADINGFGTLTTNQRKPFFQKFGWSQNLRYYGSDASNNYHSLQTRFDKRFSQGLFSDVALHVVEEHRLRRDVLPARRQARARACQQQSRARLLPVRRFMNVPVGQGRQFLSAALRRQSICSWAAGR